MPAGSCMFNLLLHIQCRVGSYNTYDLLGSSVRPPVSRASRRKNPLLRQQQREGGWSGGASRDCSRPTLCAHSSSIWQSISVALRFRVHFSLSLLPRLLSLILFLFPPARGSSGNMTCMCPVCLSVCLLPFLLFLLLSRGGDADGVHRHKHVHDGLHVVLLRGLRARESALPAHQPLQGVKVKRGALMQVVDASGARGRWSFFVHVVVFVWIVCVGWVGVIRPRFCLDFVGGGGGYKPFSRSSVCCARRS